MRKVVSILFKTGLLNCSTIFNPLFFSNNRIKIIFVICDNKKVAIIFYKFTYVYENFTYPLNIFIFCFLSLSFKQRSNFFFIFSWNIKKFVSVGMLLMVIYLTYIRRGSKNTIYFFIC